MKHVSTTCDICGSDMTNDDMSFYGLEIKIGLPSSNPLGKLDLEGFAFGHQLAEINNIDACDLCRRGLSKLVYQFIIEKSNEH